MDFGFYNICVGNFTRVKLLSLPKFKLVMDDLYHPKRIIVFPEDVIEKLTPWPICNPLNEQQYINFNQSYTKKDAHYLWYYGFDKVSNWKKNGGCVMIPECPMPNCTRYGCKKHLQQVKAQKLKPMKSRLHHTCGSNKKEHCALLSSQQGIVRKWLKTDVNQKQMKMDVNQEQLVTNVLNQVIQVKEK